MTAVNRTEHEIHDSAQTLLPPLVSVGMPVFNGAKLLPMAIESVLAQDYPHFELIISDNCSTDGTDSICERYAGADKRISYHRADTNHGGPWNFQRVFDLAAGTHFMWMAHDYRLLDTNYLSTLSRALVGHTLVFPLFVLSTYGESASRKEFELYRELKDPGKSIEAWLRHCGGYPIYGLFNRQRLIDGSYLDLLARTRDWPYFNEGLFLHKLFLDDVVAYCPTVRSFVDVTSRSCRATQEELIRGYCKYCIESARLFQSAPLDAERSTELFGLVTDAFSAGFAGFLPKAAPTMTLYKRLRTAARVLIKGR